MVDIGIVLRKNRFSVDCDRLCLSCALWFLSICY